MYSILRFTTIFNIGMHMNYPDIALPQLEFNRTLFLSFTLSVLVTRLRISRNAFCIRKGVDRVSEVEWMHYLFPPQSHYSADIQTHLSCSTGSIQLSISLLISGPDAYFRDGLEANSLCFLSFLIKKEALSFFYVCLLNVCN